MPERAFIFGSFAVLRFRGNVPVKLFQTRDQLSSKNAQLLAFSYEKMPTCPEKSGLPGQISAISRIKSPISRENAKPLSARLK